LLAGRIARTALVDEGLLIEFAMVLRWRQLFFVSLVMGVSGYGLGQVPRVSPSQGELQVFLTASGKDQIPIIPSLSDLTVSIDGKTAQTKSLHPAKDEPLLFALLVDISKSQAPKADAIKQTAMQVFQSLSTGSNQGYLVVFSHQVGKSKRPLQFSEVQKSLDGLRSMAGQPSMTRSQRPASNC
jgi:hypothetical protein